MKFHQWEAAVQPYTDLMTELAETLVCVCQWFSACGPPDQQHHHLLGNVLEMQILRLHPWLENGRMMHERLGETGGQGLWFSVRLKKSGIRRKRGPTGY